MVDSRLRGNDKLYIALGKNVTLCLSFIPALALRAV